MVMLVVGVVGSPNRGGRTRVAVDAVLRGAAGEGAETQLFELAGEEPDQVRAALERADAAVFGSPVYRADATAQLKSLLEGTPRGMWGETSAPLQGTACATVLTGASDHHFLADEKLRSILGGFFATQVLSPGLYLASAAFADEGRALGEDAQLLAETHGRALVELAAAVRSSKWLKDLRPLV
jgi:FMN reductase